MLERGVARPERMRVLRPLYTGLFAARPSAWGAGY